jgi:hypothetical protein
MTMTTNPASSHYKYLKVDVILNASKIFFFASKIILNASKIIFGLKTTLNLFIRDKI